MNAAQLIESVARAMHGNRYEWPLPEFAEHREDYHRMARAAVLATLDAIREPSEEMLEASRTHHGGAYVRAPQWYAMIDALKREVAG